MSSTIRDLVDLPAPLSAPSAPVPDGFSDRPYQIRGVRAVLDGLVEHHRGQLVAACGTGKSRMALWIAQRIPTHDPDGSGRRVVVVVVPSVALVDQTLREWATADVGHDALAVCSDDTVNPDSAGRVEDIVEPVTTDPDAVDAWLRHPRRSPVRLIVGTHVSAHVIGEGLQKAGLAADLLIVDEAHRTSGHGDKHTALLHDDDVLPAYRRLYMTATPKVYATPRARVGADRDAVLSMDNLSVFGPTLFRYSFGEAIADGFLDDYRIVVIGVTDAEVLARLRDAGLDRDPDLPARHNAVVQAAVARAAARYDLRRVVAFCSRISDARAFAESFPSTLQALPEHLRPARPLRSAHVEGRMSQQRRESVLDLLRDPPEDGWTVVSNARCLGEGVDVPAIDSVVFTHTKRSPVDIVQAVGRALRRNPSGTGIATILVPILLPDEPGRVDDADGGADVEHPGDYDVLWEVVHALRSHDDRFDNALSRARVAMFRGATTTPLLDNLHVDLPDTWRGTWNDTTFLHHLTVRLVKSTTSRWWDGFARLVQFKERTGHVDVHQREVVDGFALGQWVNAARLSRRRGLLSPDRRDALLELGFVFDPAERAWLTGYTAAKTYHDAHGDLAAPRGHRDEHAGIDLYAWLARRRAEHRAGKLAEDRFRALDALGMDWGGDAPARRDSFTSVVDEIRAFHARHGDINVPLHDPDPARAAMHRLVGRCRAAAREGTLPEHCRAELDRMGIDWEPQEQPWRDGLAAATAFHARHGHLLTAAGHVEDGYPLHRWLTRLRQDRRAGTVAPDRVVALDALGMVWDLDRQRWDDGLAAARAHHRLYGTLAVVPGFLAHDRRGDPLNLAAWLVAMRRRWNHGQLDDEQVAALDALGFVWEPTDAVWRRVLTALRAHHARHGHLRLPPDATASWLKLPAYLDHLRRLYAAGRLSPRRVALLDELGMDWSLHDATAPDADGRPDP